MKFPPRQNIFKRAANRTCDGVPRILLYKSTGCPPVAAGQPVRSDPFFLYRAGERPTFFLKKAEKCA